MGDPQKMDQNIVEMFGNWIDENQAEVKNIPHGAPFALHIMSSADKLVTTMDEMAKHIAPLERLDPERYHKLRAAFMGAQLATFFKETLEFAEGLHNDDDAIEEALKKGFEEKLKNEGDGS